MAKKKQTAQQLTVQIAKLQQQLADAQKAEQAAADEELLRLVHRAGIRPQMVAFARQQIELQSREKR